VRPAPWMRICAVTLRSMGERGSVGWTAGARCSSDSSATHKPMRRRCRRSEASDWRLSRCRGRCASSKRSRRRSRGTRGHGLPRGTIWRCLGCRVARSESRSRGCAPVRIVIALSCLQPVGSTTLIGGFQPEHADLELREPVGTRAVIDASAGVPARASPSYAKVESRSPLSRLPTAAVRSTLVVWTLGCKHERSLSHE
jgi:hypothetical protein